MIINHNQNYDILMIGYEKGYIVYSLYPFKIIKKNIININIILIEIYYNSNIILFVDESVINKVSFYDDNLNREIGIIRIDNRILNIKCNKDYVLICDNSKIYIYYFVDLSLIQTIDYLNNNNLNFCLSYFVNNYSCILIELNKIRIENLDNNTFKILNTNKNNIQYFNISNNGQYLATSSSGDKIKIFDVKKCELIRVLKRGNISANIQSIYFNTINNKIIVSSDLETIHIFHNIKENNYKIDKPLLNKISKYFDYNLFDYDFSFNRIKLYSKKKIALLLNNIFLIIDLENLIIYNGKIDETNTEISYINKYNIDI